MVCKIWQHVDCCAEARPRQDILHDLEQDYLHGSGLEGAEDDDFLLLIKTPIRRFSRGSSNPLSLEMLQVMAHQWIHRKPFVLNDHWLESMLESMAVNWSMSEVKGAFRKVRVCAENCEWRMCGFCFGQLI
jgi:hypothetical protein